MTATTVREKRARQRLNRLCRFEEILRFAAVDPDLREPPKAFRTRDRKELEGMLGIDKGVDDNLRESVLGDLSVAVHLVRAARIWDELRAGRIICAFKDLQRTLEQARRALAQFAPAAAREGRAWSTMSSAQRANVARNFMAMVFEEHETQHRIMSHKRMLSEKGRLRPLQDAAFFDVTRYAVTANMARRWYSVTGMVPRNLSTEQLIAIGCCPPSPDFCDDMNDSMRRYRGDSDRLSGLVEPFNTSPIESLRMQIEDLLGSVEAARKSYRGRTESNVVAATIRRSEALALACATLYAKRYGCGKVNRYQDGSFADFVRMVDQVSCPDDDGKFPKDVIDIVLKGYEGGRLILNAFDPLTPCDPEIDCVKVVRPPVAKGRQELRSGLRIYPPINSQ